MSGKGGPRYANVWHLLNLIGRQTVDKGILDRDSLIPIKVLARNNQHLPKRYVQTPSILQLFIQLLLLDILLIRRLNCSPLPHSHSVRRAVSCLDVSLTGITLRLSKGFLYDALEISLHHVSARILVQLCRWCRVCS